MKNEQREVFKEIITEMANAHTSSIMNRNKERKEKFENLYDQSKNTFFQEVKREQLHITIVGTEILKEKLGKSHKMLNFIIDGTYLEFLKRYILKHEGTSSHVDKARFVLFRTLKAIKDEENQSLFEDYMKYDQIKGDKEKQAYWSPKSIKDTDEAMKIFLDWYYL